MSFSSSDLHEAESDLMCGCFDVSRKQKKVLFVAELGILLKRGYALAVCVEMRVKDLFCCREKDD